MEHSYEIEIKSLLGEKANADKLLAKMAQDPSFKESGEKHKQLNHYFIKGDLQKLHDNIKSLVTTEKSDKLQHLISIAQEYSVRTRWADGKVLLIIKLSIDDTTSANGTARMEWESEINTTIEQLDQLILDAGFEYQAKWSRARTEYEYQGVTVCLDDNAGYGYIAELEIIETDPAKADTAKEKLRAMMAGLDIEELPQDRLERMFSFYNQNWRDYYSTDKTFIIE